MAFLNTIIEFEGPIVNVEPRYWAAHQAAVAAVGFQGPLREEFWRLWRTGGDGRAVCPFRTVAEGGRLRSCPE